MDADRDGGLAADGGLVGAGPVAGVDRSAVRPRRLWYGVAGAVVVAGLCAAVLGVLLAAASAGRVSSGVAEFELELRPVPDDRSASTGIELTAGEARAVYVVVTRTGPDAPYVTAPAVTCAGGGLTVEADGRDVTTVRDGVAYRPVLTVRAERAGRYRLSCGTDAGDAELMVGRELDLAALDRVGTGIVGTVAGVFFAVGSAVVGLLLGGVIALVTAVRRARHRAALAEPGPGPSPVA